MTAKVSEKALLKSNDVEMSLSKLEAPLESQHIEVAQLSPDQAAKVEKRVVLKQDLTIVLLLSGCTFFNFLVSMKTLACGFMVLG